MRIRIWPALLALAIVVVSGGCDQAAPGPPPTEPPLPGSLKRVIVPLPYDPPGFNAYLSDTGYEEVLGELVYEGLAEMAPDGSFYAKLATELPTYANGGISPDGLSVTWHLRDHVLWSDGEQFTSDDVLFTYQALSNPNNRLAHSTGVDLIDSVEVPDDFTVVLHYREPYAGMWGQFGGRGLGIFPRHACGDPGWMAGWECNTDPVGTGPFVLQSWEDDRRIVMARNPRYWQTDRPFLDRLEFPIVPDDTERADLLGDGDAQVSLWLTPRQLEYLEGLESVRLVTQPTRWLLRLVLNLNQPVEEGETAAVHQSQPHYALGDARVREALDKAIDRQRLIEEAFEGQGRVASSEFYRGWAVCPALRETAYDPAGAQALLSQAGWQDLDGNGVLEAHGVPFAEEDTQLVLSLRTSDGWEDLVAAQKLIADMWREIGIRVVPELTGMRDMRNSWQDGGLEALGQFEVDMWDDGYPNIDPTDYLIWRYASWSIPGKEDGGLGGNVMRFANPEVDRLLQLSLTQLDPVDRLPTLCQVGDVLAAERPMLYLVYFEETHGFSPELEGVVINPNDTVTWDAFNWQIE
jgi:peptide/nickel transport system substrate-binding protein